MLTADELNRRYQRQLENLRPASRAIRHMLKETRRRAGGRWRPDRPAWIWSDLHLHHRNIIRYTKRPFASCDEMDEALHRNWREVVAEDDLMLCGGDVALTGRLKDLRLSNVANAPGEKMLVLGNHDFTRRGKVAETGFRTAWMTLVIESDPPLAVTHVPLDEVPPGTVNVHGHVHNNEPLRAGPYVNICVEHTEYRPLPLSAIVRLAGELLDGRQPEGATTIERLRRIRALR